MRATGRQGNRAASWARIRPGAEETLEGHRPDPSPPRASGVWSSFAVGRGDSTISLEGSGAARGSAGPGLAVGALIGRRYRILGFLARGAVGEVYAAYDEELGSRVALKLLHAGRADDGLSLARFRREVLLGRGLAHPGLCRVFDLGFHQEGEGSRLPFLTMELLAGETLAERLARSGPLGADEALALARKLASAVAAMHDAGVLHRDLKPANILLVPDERAAGGERVVIIDFSLARRLGTADGAARPGAAASGPAGADGADVRATGTGALVGSPAYMAPEQVAGGELGPAADLYSLGVVLFEAVTGRLPFEGDSILSVLTARLDRDAPAARSLRPGLDPRWDAVLADCLARDPAHRLARAGDIPAALTAPIALDRPSPAGAPRGRHRQGAG